MTVIVRDLADEAEWERQYELVASSFGAYVTAPAEPTRAAARSTVDQRLSLVAVDDDDEHIGGCAACLFDMSLPGGASVLTAGLTGVGVRPDRGGRGAMRALVTEHLRRSKDVGAAASTLMASEAPLYGRFGYGVASSIAIHRIDTDRAALADPITDDGRVEVHRPVDAAKAAVMDVYERLRASSPGMTSRNDGWWQIVLNGEDNWKGPANPFVAVHHDADGVADAYAIYVFVSAGSEVWRPTATLEIHEFVAADVGAEKAMWQFLASVPLTRQIRWRMAPVEPRLRQLLTDRRQLDTEMVSDMLWLRPLDVEALLQSRTYERDGVAVFDLVDDLFPDQAGSWRLTVAGGRGSLERTDAPGVTITQSQLGAILLGESTLRGLADAGLLANGTDGDRGEPDRSMVGALSDLFATSVRPRSVSRF